MKKYEINFDSLNILPYRKPITCLVMVPDFINKDTGCMLFSHGWGGNRFQDESKMLYAVDRFNLICLSVEYRMSGYDFDVAQGQGWYQPYDLSFMQVFDVLGALRQILSIYPELNRTRLFTYGGSQGGHIALLTALFAPNTFAFAYASCAMTYVDDHKKEIAGRFFADYELSVRNVIEHAALFKAPVFLDHGMDDLDVEVKHSLSLEKNLRKHKKIVTAKYYENAAHNLEPATSRQAAFELMATEPMKKLRNRRKDDFCGETQVTIDCGLKKLLINWAKPSSSSELFKWQDTREVFNKNRE